MGLTNQLRSLGSSDHTTDVPVISIALRMGQWQLSVATGYTMTDEYISTLYMQAIVWNLH